MGRYFAVAVDCDEAAKCGDSTFVDIYDFTQPGSPDALLQRFRVGDQAEPGQIATITAVSVARLESGQFLLFVLGKDSRHEGWFYVSDDVILTAQTRWVYRGYWSRALDDMHNYQNVSMVTECGSGDLYMFGTSNAAYTAGSVIVSGVVGGAPGSDHISLLRISQTADDLVMDPIETRTYDPGGDDYCTFRAGATMHATSDADLALYCSTRKANTDFLGRPDSKLKMAEFAR